MVTAVVLAKDEEKNLAACLESLKWCGEIIVIDDYSQDKTLEIAKKHGAKVFQRHLDGDFASQRNFGLDKARGEWVLFVDSDECVTPGLTTEIKNVVADTENVGFYIKRRDFMWGSELRHGEVGKAEFIRLAKKGAGFWKRRVHEFWEIKGEVGRLENPLLHYPHQTIKEFVEHVEYFSTLHAQARHKEGEKSSLLKIIFWPKAKFFQNWILKLGFLDGTGGIVVALLMSFHSYLAWSKLWLLQKQKSIKQKT